jgi:hypothetical protein
MPDKPLYIDLAQFPDVACPERPVEFPDGRASRDVIRLRTHEYEHDTVADVYVFFGPESYLLANGVSDATLTPTRVSSRFVDAIRGSVIESRIWKDELGHWHAKTVDGSEWLHDKTCGCWFEATVGARDC